MLTKVEVSTSQGTTLVLPLQDTSEGYRVKDIDGLDPVKAILVSSNMASLDGAQYQSSRREPRNIVLKLGLELGYGTRTVRELRNRLYGFLMPESTVKLRFFDTDLGFVDITGTVESFDCPLFAKEPEATISLMCFNPDFYNPEPIVISGVTTTYTAGTPVVYEGTVDTGFLFRIEVTRDLPAFDIIHRPGDTIPRILEFVYPLIAGDILEISTVSRAKGVYLTRNGVRDSILYAVAPDSNWINFFPGQNNIRVYAVGEAIPYTIEYTDKIGGL